MNFQILCLIAAFTADPVSPTVLHVESATPIFLAALRGDELPPEELAIRNGYVVRGQTPYDEDPQFGDPSISANAYDPALQPAPGQYQYDPFLGPPPQGAGGYYDPFAANFSYGIYGPQPYRVGWSSRYDVGFLPKENAQGTTGSVEIFEFDGAWRYTMPTASGLIFSSTPEFGLRLFSGPDGVDLPGQVYRAAWDFELASAGVGPWSSQIGFTPQVVSDFQKSLNSDGYSFDARGVLFYRASPQWMFAMGAAFWDRVNDRIIPYAGVVWTPGDRWEVRALFPKSQISYFLGNYGCGSVWFYASGEFNVEAYQMTIDSTGVKDRGELSDWRVLLGLRSEAGGVSSFVEGGWVLDRHVKFKGSTPDFGISDGFIVRAGLRF